MKKSIPASTVLSPRNSIRALHVVFDGGLWDANNPNWSGWSVVMLTWEGRPAVGMRWNGVVDETVGSPQSRGLPTWFILPEPFGEMILECVGRHLKNETPSPKAAEAVSPRHRLLDLIAFVRSASDDELTAMVDEIRARPEERPTA
jgi:hypothetical protein